jgi:hypothetical protein
METLIDALADQIAFARQNGLGMSVRFLEMAKLDLQMQLHSLQHEDIRALCEALQKPRVRVLQGANPRRRVTRRLAAKAEGGEPEALRSRRPRRAALLKAPAPLTQAAAAARCLDDHQFASMRHEDETNAS